jgi:cellulose synthase (UDP-forming)
LETFIPFGRYRSILVSVFFIVAVWYLHWRPGSFNQNAPIFSFLLYFAEVYGTLTAVSHIFKSASLITKEPKPITEGWV